MAASTDRRVRRTRAALTDALLALMIEKGYDAITVQDLIDRADVGRSTFYLHFTDKADLLHESLAGLHDLLTIQADSARPDRRRPLRFSLQMSRHISDQPQLLKALLSHPGAGPVLAEIDQLLTQVARAELAALTVDGIRPRVPLDLLARTVVASYLATLRWWVEDDFRHTPEELETLFQTATAPGIRAALPASPPAASASGPTSATASSSASSSASGSASRK